MYTLGLIKGITLNTLFYLPMLLWLFWAPGKAAQLLARAVRGFGDIIQ